MLFCAYMYDNEHTNNTDMWHIWIRFFHINLTIAATADYIWILESRYYRGNQFIFGSNMTIVHNRQNFSQLPTGFEICADVQKKKLAVSLFYTQNIILF